MTIKAIFKCRIPSANFVFSNGKRADFIGGKYITDVEREAKELSNEVDNNHPHIYIDPKECMIDSDAPNPTELMRMKIRKELEAEMAAAVNKGDMGETTSNAAASFGNSSTVGATAIDSNSTPTALSVLKSNVASKSSK